MVKDLFNLVDTDTRILYISEDSASAPFLNPTSSRSVGLETLVDVTPPAVVLDASSFKVKTACDLRRGRTRAGRHDRRSDRRERGEPPVLET